MQHSANETPDSQFAQHERSRVCDVDVPAFLVCPPLSLHAGVPNNQSMTDRAGKVDRKKAILQYLDLVSAVSSDALLYTLPSSGDFQDLPYVSNVALVLPHRPQTVVLSNFHSPVRRGEEMIAGPFLQQLGFDVMHAPQFFEGEADVKFLGGNVYAAAYGMRTTKSFHTWFEQHCDARVIPVEIVNPYCYHLDCVLLPLPGNKLAISAPLIDVATRTKLEEHGELFDVGERAGILGSTNCVIVKDRLLVASAIHNIDRNDPTYDNEAHKYEMVEKIANWANLTPVAVDVSEFYKSGAALSCMFLPIANGAAW